MRWVTEDALMICDHGGRLTPIAGQALVRVNGRRVLAQPDPVGALIAGCPNANALAGQKPCITALPALDGYSRFVRIEGRSVALDTLSGLTDGTPPAAVRYRVVEPGQSLLSADG